MHIYNFKDIELRPEKLLEKTPSEICLKEFSAIFAKRYREAPYDQIKRDFARGGNPWYLKDTQGKSSFINLAILTIQQVREIKQSYDHNAEINKNSFNWHAGLVNHAEKVYENKTPIELEELLKSYNKIWLLGAAGCGKSTLCQNIVFNFANQISYNLNVFEAESTIYLSNQKQPYMLILWIKLRDLMEYLQNLAPKFRPVDEEDGALLPDQVFAMFLRDQLTMDIKRTWKSDIIKNLLITHANHILYLLDGYDEVMRYTDVGRHKDIQQVLNIFLLNQPNIFVTSRPYFDVPHSLMTRSAFQRVELLGFSYKNMLAYIDKHFDDKTASLRCGRLKDLLDRNINLRGIAHIPVNLEIICTLMTEIERDETVTTILSRTTTTKLYQTLIAFLIKRYWCDNPQAVKPDLPRDNTVPLDTQLNTEFCLKLANSEGIIMGFGSLALNGLREQKLTFTVAEISMHIDNLSTDPLYCNITQVTPAKLIQYLRNIGFIMGVSKGDDKDVCTYGEFLHLILQEYFAAWYLAKLWDKNYDGVIPGLNELTLQTLIIQYRYHPAFTMVWPFMLGILDEEKSFLLEEFFNSLLTSRDMLGIDETLLSIRCLNEINNIYCLSTALPWLEKYVFLLEISSLNAKGYSRHDNPLLTRVTDELHNCPAIFNIPLIRDVFYRNLNLNESSCKQALQVLKKIALPVDQEFIEKIVSAVRCLESGQLILDMVEFFVLAGLNISLQPNLIKWLKERVLFLIKTKYGNRKLAGNIVLYMIKLGISDSFLLSHCMTIIDNEGYNTGEGEEDGYRHEVAAQFIETYNNIIFPTEDAHDSISLQERAALLYILSKKPEGYVDYIFKLAFSILSSESLPERSSNPAYIFSDINCALRKISLTIEQKKELIPHIRRHVEQAKNFQDVVSGLPFLNYWAVNDNNLLPDFEDFFRKLRSKWVSETSEEKEAFILANCWIYQKEFIERLPDRCSSKDFHVCRSYYVAIALSHPIDETLHACILSLESKVSFDIFMNLCVALFFNNREKREVVEKIIDSLEKLTSAGEWRVSAAWVEMLDTLNSLLLRSPQWLIYKHGLMKEINLDRIEDLSECIENYGCIKAISRLNIARIEDIKLWTNLLIGSKKLGFFFDDIIYILRRFDLSVAPDLLKIHPQILSEPALLFSTPLEKLVTMSNEKPEVAVFLIISKCYYEGMYLAVDGDQLRFYEKGNYHQILISNYLMKLIRTYLANAYPIMICLNDNGNKDSGCEYKSYKTFVHILDTILVSLDLENIVDKEIDSIDTQILQDCRLKLTGLTCIIVSQKLQKYIEIMKLLFCSGMSEPNAILKLLDIIYHFCKKHTVSSRTDNDVMTMAIQLFEIYFRLGKFYRAAKNLKIFYQYAGLNPEEWPKIFYPDAAENPNKWPIELKSLYQRPLYLLSIAYLVLAEKVKNYQRLEESENSIEIALCPPLLKNILMHLKGIDKLHESPGEAYKLFQEASRVIEAASENKAIDYDKAFQILQNQVPRSIMRRAIGGANAYEIEEVFLKKNLYQKLLTNTSLSPLRNVMSILVSSSSNIGNCFNCSINQEETRSHLLSEDRRLTINVVSNTISQNQQSGAEDKHTSSEAHNFDSYHSKQNGGSNGCEEINKKETALHDPSSILLDSHSLEQEGYIQEKFWFGNNFFTFFCAEKSTSYYSFKDEDSKLSGSEEGESYNENEDSTLIKKEVKHRPCCCNII